MYEKVVVAFSELPKVFHVEDCRNSLNDTISMETFKKTVNSQILKH